MLPSKTAQFAEADYWDKFFAERKKEKGKSSAFEWYGDFKADLLDLVKPFHKTSFRALVLGCGNSTLSEDLVNTKCASQVTSVDFSKAAIDEMVAKTKSDSRLIWVLGDVTKMPAEYSDAYDVIWDKGALDALLGDVDGDEQSHSLGKKMLEEALRCLKPGGFYFCVSLMQEHVMRTLLDFFISSAGFESLRLASFIPRADSILCPFLLVLQKAQPDASKVSALYTTFNSTGSVPRDHFVNHVKETQRFYDARRNLKTKASKAGLRGTFSIASSSRPGHERFKLYVIDTTKTTIQCACLILPQGREHEWSFSSEEGQVQIAESNGIGRLIIVALSRNEVFDSNMEAIQNELSKSILEFAPSNLPKGFSIPYMAVAQDLGKRTVVFTGTSEFAGTFYVEDVEVDGETLRRLIFENNPLAIQSECKMVGKPPKVDTSFLSFDFHRVMMAFTKSLFSQHPKTVLICGLGGGGLMSYVQRQYPSARVEGVDIDGEVVKAAKTYFGLSVSDGQIHIQDALNVLQNIDDSSREVVMVDINGGTESNNEVGGGQTALRFPPQPFIDKELLENVCNSVLTPQGLFLLNFGCRSETLSREILLQIRTTFDGHVLVADLGELTGDLNKIICCSKSLQLQDAAFVSQLVNSLKAEFDELDTALRVIADDGSLKPVLSCANQPANKIKKKKKKKKH